jgi:hypothetical protein
MEGAMSTTAELETTSLARRLLNEGYGSGAWHGPDLKAALADVSAAAAFRRPGPGGHNIAEIAVHHAFCARNVHTQLTGRPASPFVLEGEDWFELSNEKTLSWAAIRDLIDAQQQQLASIVTDIDNGRVDSPLSEPERIAIVLGITCHAVYHAGQIQLIKRLLTEA